MNRPHIEFDEDEVDVAQKVVKLKRLRGIIFLGGYFSRSEEKLRKLNVPFVFSTAGGIPENISKDLYSNIGVDDRVESERMVDYLIGLGHQRIAIIAWQRQQLSFCLRLYQGRRNISTWYMRQSLWRESQQGEL